QLCRKSSSWQTQVLPLPNSFIPDGNTSSKLRFWSLTPKSYESGLQPQKPLSSIVFRLFRKARITLRNGRPRCHCAAKIGGRPYAEAERIGRVIERLGSYSQIPQPAGLDRARLGE